MQRITHNGTQVWPRTKQGKFTSFKMRVKYAVRWFMIRAGIGAVATGLLFVGYAYADMMQPNLSAVNSAVMAAPVTEKTIAPILKQICKAESGCKQFRKDGLPVMHANTNGSVDIGKYQINNSVWGAKAHELRYDLLTEEGNEAMATWILENKGSGPWFSSAKGWEK